MKRKGLMMIELMIALMIITISAGMFTLRANFWTVTPKREAERLFAKLSSLMLRSARTQTHFQLVLWPEKIVVQWNSEYTDITHNKERFVEDINASNGCSYSWNAPNDVIYYSYITNKYSQGATITITNGDNKYYVIIATIGSRIRISDTTPNSS